MGDYDNDGHPDLFVTRWRSYALYRNQGDGTFEDVTERGRSGRCRATGRPRRPSPTSTATATSTSTSATILDWDPQRSHPCPDPRAGQVLRLLRPAWLRGHARPRLPQRWRPVRRCHGPRRGSSTATAAGWASSIADLDDDGRLDIFVANDMTANFLFRNRGGFRFEEIGEPVGRGHQRRRGIPGRHGDRLRRPRRRRPARPGRDELLRRVDVALSQPRARDCSPTGPRPSA